MKKIRIPFSSFGCYRRWSIPWWQDLVSWLFIDWWRHDALAYWHRARYGWAPRDVIALGDYAYGVIGGTLLELADDQWIGTPANYPHLEAMIEDDGMIRPFNAEVDSHDDIIMDDQQWREDLQRWGETLLRASDRHGDLGVAETIEAQRAARKAIVELVPWWDSLWT